MALTGEGGGGGGGGTINGFSRYKLCVVSHYFLLETVIYALIQATSGGGDKKEKALE